MSAKNKLTSGFSVKDRIMKKFVGVFNGISGNLFGAVLCPVANHTDLKSFDYVREAALRLTGYKFSEEDAGEHIGAVAELGVFRGDFAQIINQTFPHRKLYLFDTFEGFHARDVEKEEKENFSAKRHDFSKTNVELVLRKMKYPENCIIKKGYFPDTTAGLEETFVFVSLDADLYEPTYAGLKYFYPRLQKGGYIFVHDYNNIYYLGVKKAVEKYSKETGAPFFPLPDGNGSAVFMK